MMRFLLLVFLAFTLVVPNVHADDTDKKEAPKKRLTLKERIKRAAKKAAEAAKKAAKKAGDLAKKAGKATVKMAKKAGKAAKKAAKKAGELAKKAGKATVKMAKKAGKATKDAAKKAGKAASKAMKKAGEVAKKAVNKAKETVNKVFKKKPTTQAAIKGPITQAALTPKTLPIPSKTVLGIMLTNGTVRVCVRSDVPPFGFFKGQTLSGFDVELAKQIVSGISIRYGKALKIRWVVINAKDRIPNLQQGRCDMVVGTFSMTVARTKQVGFSQVYLSTHKVLVSHDKIARKKPILATVSGTTGKPGPQKGTSTVQFYNYNDILGAMKRGQVDYVLADHPTASYLVKNSKGYKISRVFKQVENYAVGLHKHHEQLKKEVDAVLKYLARSGYLAHFKRKWVH